MHFLSCCNQVKEELDISKLNLQQFYVNKILELATKTKINL